MMIFAIGFHDLAVTGAFQVKFRCGESRNDDTSVGICTVCDKHGNSDRMWGL